LERFLDDLGPQGFLESEGSSEEWGRDVTALVLKETRNEEILSMIT
jgi:hypothetical protein